MAHRFAKRLQNVLRRLEKTLAAASLLLLLLLSLLQIFLRNVFDFGYPEIDIINRNLLIICGAMGAVLATDSLRHIKIDALTPLLSERLRRRLRCPLALFSAGVCLLMAWYALAFVRDEWQYAPANERWTLPFTLIYPLGFALLALHFALNCRQRGQEARDE